MTTPQRISLMADLWPKACRAQGWKAGDRDQRMRVLSEALNRPLESANEINNTDDFDRVKAHLGMLADSLASTVETLDAGEAMCQGTALGRARRLRATIREQLKCLALYLVDGEGESMVDGQSRAEKYLAEIIRDKFQRGSRYVASQPLTIEDLDADKIIYTRNGHLREIPSQLDQVVITLARNIQTKRKAAGDSIHDMRTKAGLKCECNQCVRPRIAREMVPF